MIAGQFINSDVNVDSSVKNQIIDIVSYMDKRNRIEELKYLPKDFKLSEENFTRVFGFSNKIEDKTYLGYSYTDNLNKEGELGFNMDIEGYKNIIFVYSLDNVSTSGNYKFERDKKEINIYKKINEEYRLQKTIDLIGLRDKLKTLKKTKNEINLEDLTIEDSNMKIYFTNLYFGNDENIENAYVEFYLLTK